jgi:tetratricopeptide (TPR) repeat protein
MAIIPLRAYNREIEGMIDNGQLDEAVAHCRHILTTFPKYIASYRLLGKAHLEQQRISDATDIFQRVLSSVPDDFIANVGMSIIREDENNLDAAIWHMELAYEAQPANGVIQDELRRLYGRRDGIQPPKVRLTRGALARMYSKGGLFDQAIAELRAAIAEDPNRPDLQLLLAQMFYQTSQRVEAVDTCVNIIKKIPFCLEANRILSVSLPVAEGSDAVKNYRQIVISMDPYFAFASPDSISSDQVPENAVNIERLDYKSGIQIGETHTQPNWATSLGISMEKSAEEQLPDWLKSAEAPPSSPPAEQSPPSVSPFIWDTQEVEKIITDTSKPNDEIPDWMKDAGWQPASGEASQVPEEIKPEEPIAEVPATEALDKADIPEWLSEIAPEGVLGEESRADQPQGGDLSTPWLEEHQPGPTDSIIQWLDEKKPEAPTSPLIQEKSIAPTSEEEMPDWLKDLDIPQTPSAQAEISAESTPAAKSEQATFKEEPAIPESPEAKVSQFEGTLEQPLEIRTPKDEILLPFESPKSAETAAESADEIPDWLKELAGELPAAESLIPAAEKAFVETPQITEPEPTSGQPITAEELPVAEMPSIPQEVPGSEVKMPAEEPTPSMVPAISEEGPVTELPMPAEEPTPAEVSTISEETPVTELLMPAVEITPAEVPTISEEAPVTELPPSAEEITPAEVPTISEGEPAIELPLPAEEITPAEVPTIYEGEPATEQPTSAEEMTRAEAPVISEEEPATELPLSAEEMTRAEAPAISEEVPTTEIPAPALEFSATEIPPVSEERPHIEQPLPTEGVLEPVTPGSEIESSAFAGLEGLAGQQGTKEAELITPTEEHEIQPPEWEKLKAEPGMKESSIEYEPKPEETTAVPAEEIPEWIKGLGETPEIVPVPEEPASAIAPETPIPQAEEIPTWLLEMEQPESELGQPEPELGQPEPELGQPGPELGQPEPEKEEPVASKEALEWKSDQLPEWLKEIAEVAPAEAAPPVVEIPATEEVPEIPFEPGSQLTGEITPVTEVKREVLEEPQPEAASWVPEIEEPIAPPSAIPVEAVVAPTPVVEESITKTVDTLAAPPEAPIETTELVSEVNQSTLSNARNAINQGLPSQAVEYYNGLIKQNYQLDEIIKDLQAALNRFPVDVDMWITLGDAHFRAEELQEALNAYTKAEELVR